MSDPPATRDVPLSRRILSETARFAALQTLAAVLSWSASILLARLLDRRDFGVYGICSFYIGVGALLGDGGLGATLLRRRGEVREEEYRVAMTTLVAVSGVLALVLAGFAPWIGRHNHLTAAETSVLRAMAPLYFVSAFRVVPYIRLERELLFSRIARIELTASLVRHVLAISVALAAGGVWALVISNIVGSALQLGLAYRASPGWVGLGWSWRVFRPLIAYGGQVQALNVCAYLKDNISRALLGAAVGPGAVGIFDFGLSYIQIPVAAVNSLARVQLPVYARLEAGDPTLYEALRGAMRTAMVFGTPLLCALALASPWLVPTVYESKWMGALPVIWGLLPNMVGGLCASPLFTLLQGQGRAGLAIAIFFGWTVTTWTLAIIAVVVRPGDLGLIALAHSVVTVAVVVGLLVWAGRHLRKGLFSSLQAPAMAGMFGLAVGVVASRIGVGWVRHPLTAAAACVSSYSLVLLLLDRGRLVGELRAILSSTRARDSK